jgi:hypothetical protein
VECRARQKWACQRCLFTPHERLTTLSNTSLTIFLVCASSFKVNNHEAELAVSLAYYLVACGVERSSIAILTPYKGQLMLMRGMFLKDKSNDRLLTFDSAEKNQIRISTVDRFQGDEADIVIISLVVDENSRTPFVKLVNRMIGRD